MSSRPDASGAVAASFVHGDNVFSLFFFLVKKETIPHVRDKENLRKEN
jgi:hypothetical protein